MKKFFLVLLFLTGFFFSASVASSTNISPPLQPTVSMSQQQLAQIATINTMVEQNVIYAIQQNNCSVQERAAMTELYRHINQPIDSFGKNLRSMRHSTRNAVLSGTSFSNCKQYNPNCLIRSL